jgi:hypothetical protein
MKTLFKKCLEPRGIALVVVLALIAVLVLMAVAVHSISESELNAARVHSDGQEARQLSEVAVNIVMAQLRKATDQGRRAIGERTWVSQPGLVRCYERTTMSSEAYKLYSSLNMILRKPGQVESALLADVPDAKWRQMKDQYVDLNAPVFRTDASGNPRTLFPIVDPRAMSDKPTESINGFSYRNKMLNGANLEGVVLQGGDAQRVPMPVEWLYVLQDGSVGALNSGGKFIGERQATRENPIVGRVAFWTDDESSKININTASEPTYWTTPIFTHERDAGYARFQPANGEFQRYPGHPATTALSPVLFPGQTLNAEKKESIYQLIPKISTGGSVAGTQSYLNGNVTAVDLNAARAERLFSSVDELLLAENRTPNLIGGSPVTAEWLQKAGFFLTANSRSPEMNPFGLPKISIWPVSYRGPDYRTGFDQLMLHCSTLLQSSGKRSYIFQRGWADSLTQDVEYGDNQVLLHYLRRLLSARIAGYSESDSDTFKAKYDKDLPQILIEIFDYIRGTNLCDSFLAINDEKVLITGMSKMLGYETGTTRRTGFKTFTDPLNYVTANGSANAVNGIAQGNGYPGHGQTIPSRWKGNGFEVQGIGRFPTITEVGLHFICCADNTEDADNPFAKVYDFIGKPGGRGAPRKAPTTVTDPVTKKEKKYDRWFSNFPPSPKSNPLSSNTGPDLIRYPLTQGYPYGPDKTHPGYQKFNWNHQLDADKPLRPGFRRVQARLLLEFFVPAHGYPAIQPELTVMVLGLGKLRLNGVRLFPNDREILFTSNGDVPTHNNIIGGHGLGFNSLIGERYLPARAPMPPDNGWGNPLWIIKPAQFLQTEDLAVNNYNLVSNFVDVEVGMDGSKPMLIDGSGASNPLQIEIWSGHIGRQVTSLETEARLVQTLQVPIFDNSVQAPTLVRNSLDYPKNTKAEESISVHDPEPISFWTFYAKGALGFNLEASPIFNKSSHYTSGQFGANGDTMGGRMYKPNGNAYGAGGVPYKGACFYGYDYPAPGVDRTFNPIIGSSSTINGAIKAEEMCGCDVVQSVLIAHGDYRNSASLVNVPVSEWATHRYYGKRRLAHNFKRLVTNTHPGFDYGGLQEPDKHLSAITVNYHQYWSPDFPKFSEASKAAQKYEDYDNSFLASDGAYINKPDEGNLNRVTFSNGVLPYLIHNTVNSAGTSFFSPNRMVSSPVMFGSLPSGVHGKVPWRTLLFRPQKNHFGAGLSQGGVSPPDHLFLEFFWMPVVEPYAISGPMMTAGKVNMNYQMYPFTHIHRATGMHAVLAGSEFSAVPLSDAKTYHNDRGSSGVFKDLYYSDALGKIWHHDVDIEKTLSQFEARFSQGKAFVYPSEICSIYMVPKSLTGQVSQERLENFWKQHRLTGDNVRERPYSSLYPRLTTRSNTFRVHCIAQTLKKARTSPPDRMTGEDRVTGEYRGSTLIERYLDPSQSGMPDFADAQNTRTLDHFTQYRVIESKRFGY